MDSDDSHSMDRTGVPASQPRILLDHDYTRPPPSASIDYSDLPRQVPRLVSHPFPSTSHSIELEPSSTLPSPSHFESPMNLPPPPSLVSHSPSSPSSRRALHFDDPDWCARYRAQERDRYRARQASMTESERRERNAARRQRRRELNEDERPHARAARLAVSRLGAAQLRLHSAGFSYDPAAPYRSHPLILIGDMSKICRFCQARCFPGEAKGICCSDGQVRLTPFEQPPEPILELFSGGYPDSNHFLENIRGYNSCFQMTSFGVTSNTPRGGWASTFVAQGQIYHLIGSLLPMPDDAPKFLQI